MTKDDFTKLISEQLEWSNKIDKICDVLNSNLYECDWINYTYKLFDKILALSFNEYGIDDINWWVYEKDGNPELKMYDKDKNEIPTETIDDLWKIVKDYRK